MAEREVTETGLRCLDILAGVERCGGSWRLDGNGKIVLSIPDEAKKNFPPSFIRAWEDWSGAGGEGPMPLSELQS